MVVKWVFVAKKFILSYSTLSLFYSKSKFTLGKKKPIKYYRKHFKTFIS